MEFHRRSVGNLTVIDLVGLWNGNQNNRGFRLALNPVKSPMVLNFSQVEAIDVDGQATIVKACVHIMLFEGGSIVLAELNDEVTQAALRLTAMLYDIKIFEKESAALTFLRDG